MRRSTVLIVMLLAMLWQSMAMARVGSTVNPLSDPAHAMLHWNAESHHHHEDGSYHVDDSKESVQHMLADHLNVSVPLPSLPALDLPSLQSAAPDSAHTARAPNPALDGLLRPPRPGH